MIARVLELANQLQHVDVSLMAMDAIRNLYI